MKSCSAKWVHLLPQQVTEECYMYSWMHIPFSGGRFMQQKRCFDNKNVKTAGFAACGENISRRRFLNYRHDLPISAGSSESGPNGFRVCGVWSNSGWRSLHVGGNWNNGTNAGVAYANGNNSLDNSNSNIGARLSYLPSETCLLITYSRKGPCLSAENREKQ